MDCYQGRCRLEWWANSATLLASAEIAVDIAAAGAGWRAHGQLFSDDGAQREWFTLLCGMDPVFLLKFDDGSSIAVTVQLGEDDQFALTEYTGPTHRPINHQIDL